MNSLPKPRGGKRGTEKPSVPEARHSKKNFVLFQNLIPLLRIGNDAGNKLVG